MSAYRHALAVDAAASDQLLAQAADVLASGDGVVLFEGMLALRATRSRLLCEVIDPTPSARRCANEYEVLVENAKRALEASRLRELLPDLPCRWSVVDDFGTNVAELWPAP
jgi:hypothetical protein